MDRHKYERLNELVVGLLKDYKVDYFQGVILLELANFIVKRNLHSKSAVVAKCLGTTLLGFKIDQNGLSEQLEKLDEIAQEVKMTDAEKEAMARTIRGEWVGVLEVVRDLRTQSQEDSQEGEDHSGETQCHQTDSDNQPLIRSEPMLIVVNRLTDAICGEFETYGQASKWVVDYINEQNVGLDPEAPEYCSPFDFILKSK